MNGMCCLNPADYLLSKLDTLRKRHVSTVLAMSMGCTG